MALNLKNRQVERLVAEVASLAGETKTEAVRRALEERRARLHLHAGAQDRAARVQRALESIWRQIPANPRRTSKRERERILGYGPEGV